MFSSSAVQEYMGRVTSSPSMLEFIARSTDTIRQSSPLPTRRRCDSGSARKRSHSNNSSALA